MNRDPMQVCEWCCVILGQTETLPLPQVMQQQPQWFYLDLCHLKQQYRSDHPGSAMDCLGTRLGSGTSTSSWPRFSMPTCGPTVPSAMCPPPQNTFLLPPPHPFHPPKCLKWPAHLEPNLPEAHGNMGRLAQFLVPASSSLFYAMLC